MTIRLRRLAALLALGLAVAGISASQPLAVSPDVVISQVYGGGGNAGATYTHDFIELYNRGSSTVAIDGWSVQYASATGNDMAGDVTLRRHSCREALSRPRSARRWRNDSPSDSRRHGRDPDVRDCRKGGTPHDDDCAHMQYRLCIASRRP